LYNIQISWGPATGSWKEIFYILLTFPDSFDMNKELNLQSQTKNVYQFQGMVCFQGAHYKAVFRNRQGGRYKWTCFNDTKKEGFETWADVVQMCYETDSVPTFVIFQRADQPILD